MQIKLSDKSYVSEFNTPIIILSSVWPHPRTGYISKNNCYLYFTGSQNADIKQSLQLQQQGEYHVSSQRCHPMLVVDP